MAWQKEFAAHYPDIAKMASPLTLVEYHKLLERGYTPDAIKHKLQRMDNLPDLQKKYKSTYKTLLNWLKAPAYGLSATT